jgi:hypothetical protein
MNTDWNDLIQRHIAGLTTDGEAQRLSAALKKDDALTDLYIRHIGLELALEAKAASAEGTRQLLTAPTLPEKIRPTRWLSWRPLTAAAAGIAFGMFCTTLVFGYALPSAVATASRLFVLVDGSFEKTDGRVASGFPSEFGKWSGDEAEVVSGNAKDGKQALRFVQAEREPRLPNTGAAACDVYQLVDLRPLKSKGELGDTTLELSAQFLDGRDVAGEKVRFLARLHVYAGNPEGLGEDWPLPKKEALATGSGITFSTGGSPQTWRKVATMVFLPREADFAVVQLLVNIPEGRRNRTAPATFGAQFADDVRLTLKTQPALPVRLAER